MKLFTKLFHRQDPILAELESITNDVLQKDAERVYSGKQLPNITARWKDQNSQGVEPTVPAADAFALVMEACRRLKAMGPTLDPANQTTEVSGPWTMEPYREQVMCGVALHLGKVAEMATGEGKTLAAVMPAYLNALSGNPAIVVTANEYLARRDAQWMKPLYDQIGLTVGCSLPGQHHAEKAKAYASDVIYTTATELGFDYLRDNTLTRHAVPKVMRKPSLVIIDEADYVLLDGARTPMGLSLDDGQDQLAEKNGADYRARVQRLIAAQDALLDAELAKAQKCSLDNPILNDALLLLHLGAPRSSKLAELLTKPGIGEIFSSEKRRITGVNARAELTILQNKLYFTFMEKDGSVTVSEKGVKVLAPEDPDFLTLPDISSQLHDISLQTCSPAEKQAAQNRIHEEYQNRQHQVLFIQHMLRAFCLLRQNVEYVVQDGKAIIVDPNTGRLLLNLRYGNGLHTALEIKEGLPLQSDSSVAGLISMQNLLKQFPKLAGMTGTAKTEEPELLSTYGLGVVSIPTHVPCIRQTAEDSVFRTKAAKMNAILREVQRIHAKGRPILIGTESVQTSTQVSQLLDTKAIPHVVLNARQPEQESKVIAQAGTRGAVTIAANMAGRGTDIQITDEVRKLGGLYVIGVERHEARRLDLQLAGRCARQGDPGTAHFFSSFEDDLMRLFASPKADKLLATLGMNNQAEITHPWLTGAIAEAQKSVERRNLESRKRVQDLDLILDPMRKEVYAFRDEILQGKSANAVETWTQNLIRARVQIHAKENNVGPLLRELETMFCIELQGQIHELEGAEEKLVDLVSRRYQPRRPEKEAAIVLLCLDKAWRNTLQTLIQLQNQLNPTASDNAAAEMHKQSLQLYELMKDETARDACRAVYALAAAA